MKWNEKEQYIHCLNEIKKGNICILINKKTSGYAMSIFNRTNKAGWDKWESNETVSECNCMAFNEAHLFDQGEKEKETD